MVVQSIMVILLEFVQNLRSGSQSVYLSETTQDTFDRLICEVSCAWSL